MPPTVRTGWKGTNRSRPPRGAQRRLSSAGATGRHQHKAQNDVDQCKTEVDDPVNDRVGPRPGRSGAGKSKRDDGDDHAEPAAHDPPKPTPPHPNPCPP